MNHIRVIALVLAIIMILTLFVFAVDGVPSANKTTENTAGEAIPADVQETALIVTAAEKTEELPAADKPIQTVPVETIKSIETTSSAEHISAPAAIVSETVTEAVKDAVAQVQIEETAEEMPEPEQEEAPAVQTKKTARASKNKGTYNWGVTCHKLSAEDRELVERVVAAEAMGCEYDGLVGVAQVIRERAESWGMTAREVVTADKQFAAPYQGELTDEVRQAVSDVFDYGVRVFAEHTTHFHNTSVDPFWNKNKEFRGEIDTHLFWGVDE